ncbi:B12-binding domain-containing radical SAM protein [Lachnoclostridium sp. An131]|uniref:B12-binding domain-containing radical SAM protein n=1 Tax=Lachnoclostridium sp. An131 TaxID=1965555 RepID=UPI000B366727|nr:B12-binding domain-containing radical SAM protein [Lachnoclostridium sp. An131]OUQ25601.1 B12-binding domain-containing radical SAM protein [Lachnoclostridium sp. An131]
MKFLLTAINAKYIHSNLAVYSLRAAALAAAPASDKHEPFSVELAEFTINHRTEEILRDIFLRKPDVLLFSCYIWNIVYVRELAENCKKIMPEVPVWLGGPEVSYDAEKFLRENPAADGILCGEGEETFRLLAECYAAGQADTEHLAEIPGLVFREPVESAARLIRVNTPAPLPDLSALPFPYGELAEFENRIIYYESSRGCPFSCSYCLSSIEKSVRFRDIEKVCRELQFFLDRRVPQVKFVDRTFNCRKSHAMAVWSYILEHDNGITNFHFEIEAELLDEEELALLERMRPGLVQLEIGVQSANRETLKAVRRSTDLERLRRVVERIRDGKNIHQHLDLIAGLPFEDYESFGHSFDQVFALKPEQLQLGFLKVLKGAPMYEDARKYGIAYRSQPPYEVLFTPWLPFSDILRLKMIEEMVEIYYNSHQFGMTLGQLIPRFSSAFAFFEQLALYYERNQEGQKSSRVRKYELLLGFASEHFPEDEDRYRELLTIDYYLRERAKARPSFAPDPDPYKKTLREIRQRAPKQVHVEALSRENAAVLFGEQDLIYLIFDYEKRNPLTGDACLSVWREEGAG